MLSRLVQFLTTDIWRMRLKNYPRSKSFFLKQLRIFLLSVRGFVEDKCKFRASALTFFTLLSIVPVIAMMFGIAKGFGLQDKVEAQLRQMVQAQTVEQTEAGTEPNEPVWTVQAQPEQADPNVPAQTQPFDQGQVVEKIITFSKSLLDEAKGGVVAGIGVVFLFWSIVKLLSNIEKSFNDIWGVKIPRSIGRRFSDYLSLILICPILLVISSSLTVIISGKIDEIIKQYEFFSFLGPFVEFLIKLVPYFMVWVVFTFLFVFMPNTKVRLRSGIFAGIIAGTIFQLVQWLYITFQIGVARYGAIYGSFAALPLFLLWLQISWLVVLFGAELSFAHQNVETYEFEPDSLLASYSFKKLISLVITHSIIRNFCEGEAPLDAEDISHKLEIPIRLVRLAFFELVESGILSEVKKNGGKDVAYQPAVDVGKLSVEYIVTQLEKRGKSDIPIEKTEALEKLSDSLSSFTEEIRKSPANVLLKDI
ncbi:MAG: YihY/virulence factor BrkB family protein [Sedimentisphaerales bacterium]|nr:YihY/virulence factor BrkB family protein [Sedimentisphaerales bacterium]